jgi:hypothetical protein
MTWSKCKLDELNCIALSLRLLFKEQRISPSPTVVDLGFLIESIRKYMGFTAFL